MWYQKFEIENNVIVYSMSILGPQIIELNGKIIARKNQNKFPNTFLLDVISNNKVCNQIRLVSKMDDNSGEILLDIFKNNNPIESNVNLKGGKFRNKYKIEGISKLKDFELNEALELLQKGLTIVPFDSDIYFNLACIYSLQENIKNGIQSLELAIKYGFTDLNAIKTNDKLAYLRIQDEYEKLLNKISL